MESVDVLALTCKALYEERLIEQRKEIERLKKELTDAKTIKKMEVWLVKAKLESDSKMIHIAIFLNEEEAEATANDPEYDKYNSIEVSKREVFMIGDVAFLANDHVCALYIGKIYHVPAKF